ncbi:MAG: hypothetical protein MJ063_01235 [Lachnospiraceae bacterium]|nr:hypothetical protein [Lachnospiraceae bacterium]
MKCLKTAVLVLAAVAVLCFPAFAGTSQVTVERKAPSSTEDGYLLLSIDETNVEKLFDYPNGNLIPGDTAEGNLRFVLEPGITPMKARITATDGGSAELFSAMELKITRGDSTLYDGLLKNVTEVSLGSFVNNGGIAASETLKLELTFTKGKSLNDLQGKKLAFSLKIVADMTDYYVIKPEGYVSGGSVEVYQSLYNDKYYYPASGVPVLEGQFNKRGTVVDYAPDYVVEPGKDGKIGNLDDYYIDYADGLNVYVGTDNVFGTADDRKDLQPVQPGSEARFAPYGSNIERGSHKDSTDDFGGGKAANYQNDKRYTNGEDGIPGTADDELIYKGRDGVYGTKLDYTIKSDTTNARPGADTIWGTEDDEIWYNGYDRIPGTRDDTLLGYPNQEKTSGGGHSTFTYEADVSGNAGMASSPVAFAKAVDGSWSFDGKSWHFTTTKGEQAKNKWVYIYSKVLDQNDWYYFDGNGVMQSGWQKTGSGKWYRLHSVNDARFGAMEKGLFFEPEDGKYYYLDPQTGVLQTGWIKINDKYYYFAETSTGLASWFWNTSLGRWAYNAVNGRPAGSMYIDEVTPDGYRVDKTGARIEGSQGR